MTNYIWSDNHFSHRNIIRYCNRPFEDNEDGTELMNSTMLKNWRETVTNNDVLFNLGDFCFKWSKERLQNTLSNLPGYKILVLGNHDRRYSVKWWLNAGFDEVYPYPIIYKKFFILSHEQVFLNDRMPYINIHGHIHQHNSESKCYINVSVEQTKYKPIRLDEIVERNTNI